MRLIPMQCGDDESYALLFYDKGDVLKLDIYDAQTKALVQSLDSPFPVGSAQSIRYIQSFDVVFFAQGDTRPCKLMREDAADGKGYKFRFETIEIKTEPLMDWDMVSEHTIEVFSLPDYDIANKDASGRMISFPKGVVRKDKKEETLTLSNIKTDIENETISIKYKFYYFYAKTQNAKKYSVGDVVYFTENLIVSVYSPYYGENPPKGSGLYTFDGGFVEHDPETLQLSLFGGRVSSTDAAGVWLYVCYTNFGPSGYENYVSIGDVVQWGKFVGKYGETTLRITTADNVPLDAEITDGRYYSPVLGTDYELAMTIDGSNTNDALVEGQIIALKHANKLYDSRSWDYDTYPVGTVVGTYVPPVEVVGVLDSKTDGSGTELRPTSGGGFGMASDWKPVRGTVELKTDGVWSGIIELQELTANGTVQTVATISSENGMSNTSLERDITEFGSSVRVACVRREYAYDTQASINGDFALRYIVTKADTGLQWQLSSADVQTVFLRVVRKQKLSDGRNVYIVKCYGGITDAFSTTSYALGAWSTKNGFPQHVCIFQERIVYAANKQKPTTIWCSKTNDWEDFESGTLDTSPMNFTIQTDKYDAIRWLRTTKSYIAIGTDNGEWNFGDGSGGVATPSSGRFVNASNIGSGNVPAQSLGNVLLSVKTGRKEIHRIDYNTLSEESAGTQISMYARHLFEDDAITDMFSVRSPTNTLYCLCESGKLVSLTYEPEYGVMGFARQEILDGVVCATTVRRRGADLLCMVVKKGDGYLLGEIDSSSSVYTDDGESFESLLVPTPLARDESASAYGKRAAVAGADIYVCGATRFNARLSGGDWVRVDKGFGADGKLSAYEEHKITLPAAAGWRDEAIVEIKTDYDAPLKVAAVGASISTS